MMTDDLYWVLFMMAVGGIIGGIVALVMGAR